jgi:two-component system nitrogen regulation response regulator GlnG
MIQTRELPTEFDITRDFEAQIHELRCAGLAEGPYRMPTLVIVDDEPNVRYSLAKSLRRDTLRILTAGTAKEGLALIEQERPDVVLMDVRLPDLSGLEAHQRVRQFDARLPVIIITAFASTETAINAMRDGAFEYLLKPVDILELRRVVDRALEASRQRHVPAVIEPSDESTNVDQIVGQSVAMQEVYKAIGRVASQDIPVLILGESGTGKELVARAIYHYSARSQAPYLAINCAAISENLLESELFGHERGAFTGADRRRVGKFEQCHGGTLFLDEVGDLSAGAQARMLRLLQDGRFERVGGNETISTDVRLIAATNRDLSKLVDEGRFRLDLFYRLNVITITLPALRDRVDDIPRLAEHFVRQLSPLLSKKVTRISSDALELLTAHPWPGNVRELQNVMKYALVQASSTTLTADCLPQSLKSSKETFEATQPQQPGNDPDSFDVVRYLRSMLKRGETDLYRQVQAELDRIVLREVLAHVKDNQVQASELLGISRTTLRSKLAHLGTPRDDAP